MERLTAQTVTAAEVSRNFGLWQDRASHGPLVVTHHGRPRIVMLAIDAYDRMSQNSHVPVEHDDGEMKLAMLAENVTGCFAAFDRELRFTYVNSEATVHFGKPAEMLQSRGMTELFPETKDCPAVAAFRRVAAGGEQERVETPSCLHANRMMRLRIFPYPGGVAAIFQSIAHEQQIVNEANERVALFEAGDVHGGAAVTRVSLRSTFEQPDNNLAALAELPRERLRNARLIDLLVPKDRPMATGHLEAVLGQGERRSFLARLLTNSGRELPVQIGLSPVRDGFKISGAMMLLTVLQPTSGAEAGASG